MSAELTAPHGVRHASRWWLLRDVAIVLAVFAVVGALAGVWWELWWTPPSGVVLEGAWYPDDDGVRELFSATGLFVVVALTCGVLAGAACAWYVDRAEVLTMLAVLAGSVLATWLMLQVGQALAPPDPALAARTAVDLTELPGTLEISGDGALVSFPAGALTGVVVVFIGLTPSRRSRG
jgi:hypothetical protein